MNLNTSEFFRNVIKSGINYSKTTGTFGPLAARMQALRSYGRRLTDTNQAYNILLSCMSADSDIISNDILDLPSISDRPAQDIYANISSETHQLIVEAFEDVCEIIDPDDSTMATLIDGDGLNYKIKIDVVDGEKQVFQVLYDENGLNPTYIPVTRLQDGVYSINNCITAMNGAATRTISSWLHSLSISATINTISNKACTLLTSGKATAAALLADFQDFLSSKISSVKRWASTLVTIFTENGFSGLVNYILKALNLIRTDVADENGVMVWTDNKKLIPQEFIGTMIATIATTIGGVLVAVGGVVLKIIGAAIAIGAQIASWFTKTAWANYNSETLAGIVDYQEGDTSQVLPEAPHALCQWESYFTGDGKAMLDEISNGISGIICFEVPGGYVHVGKSNEEGLYRMEFHPAVFWTTNNIPCDYFGTVPTGSQASALHFIAVPRQKLDATYLEDLWDNGYDVGAEYSLSNNFSSQGAAVVTSKTDEKIRFVILRNLGIFLLWLNASCEANFVGYNMPIGTSGTVSKRYGIQMNYQGANVGAYSATFHLPVVYALLPKPTGSPEIYSFTYQNPDATPTTGVSVFDIWSWTNIGNYAQSFHDTDSVSKTTFMGLTFPGNNLTVYYYISSGQWYPDYSRSGGWCVVEDFDGTYSVFGAYNGYYMAMSNKWFMGEPDFINGSIISGIYTPKYNRETYWWWVGLVAAATVVVAVGTVVASLKIKKAINNKRASNAAKVEQAWASLIDDPSNTTKQEAYRKQAKKANLWAKVFGGTTFDTSNYWGSGSSDTSSESQAGKLMNLFTSDEANEEIATEQFNDTVDTSSTISTKVSEVKRLISGTI